MSEPFASSRFLLWEKPPAYPFFDIITKDTDPGPTFDLNIDLDSYDGSVYIKIEHIVEMARTLGMATIDEVSKLREENAELRRQVTKLPSVQEELKSGLDDLVAKFFASLNTVDSGAGISDTDSAQDNRESAETERETVGPFNF